MGNTTKYLLPYPEDSDDANVPEDIKNLAEAVEKQISAADKTKADTAIVEELKTSTEEIRKLANVGIKDVEYDSETGKMTFTANDSSTLEIDLPLELLIDTGTYSADTKTIILTLANSDVIEIPIGDLITDFYNKSEIDAKETAINEKLGELDNRVNHLERTTGVRFEVEKRIKDENGNTITTTEWTRRFDAVGLTAQATHDGTEVQNDFDTLPIYRDIITVEEDDNGNILHYYDEDGYNPKSGNNIMTILPDMYLARYYEQREDGIYEIRGVATQKFNKYYQFYKGRKKARYEGCLDTETNKLRSISDKVPLYSRTIKQFRTYARNNGSKFEIDDIWTRFMVETLYLVEYANSNSQLILGNGISVWLGDNLKALVAETNVNRIIIATNATTRARLYEGKCITIGTSAAWNGGVCKDRRVTSVEDYNDGTVTGMAVYFDGEPVNIAVGNVLWGSAQATGQCDALGMKSGCLINDNEHSVIYRGIENPFGNMWEWIDGINCKAGNETYVCRDHTKYASDIFSGDYVLIGYTKLDAAEGWTKILGYDENNPEIALPIEVGANSTTGLCDYYYNKNSVYNRVARVGGCFSNGAYCGLFYWHFHNGSGDPYWHSGARLLEYQE